MTAETRASLFDIVAAANWAHGDMEKALEMLEKPGAKPENKRREMQQCLPALLSYFSSEEWGLLMSDALQRSDKVDLFFRRLFALGVRNISEPSMKFLNSTLLLLLHGEKAIDIPTAENIASLQQLKREFKQRSRTLPQPLVYLNALPTFPQQLSTECAKLYNAAVGDLKLVPAQVSGAAIERIYHSYPCRGSGFSQAWGHVGSPTGQQDPSSALNFGFKVLLDNVTRMHEAQMNSQLTMLGNSGSSSSGGPLRSLAALAAPPPRSEALPIALSQPAIQLVASQPCGSGSHMRASPSASTAQPALASPPSSPPAASLQGGAATPLQSSPSFEMGIGADSQTPPSTPHPGRTSVASFGQQVDQPLSLVAREGCPPPPPPAHTLDAVRAGSPLPPPPAALVDVSSTADHYNGDDAGADVASGTPLRVGKPTIDEDDGECNAGDILKDFAAMDDARKLAKEGSVKKRPAAVASADAKPSPLPKRRCAIRCRTPDEAVSKAPAVPSAAAEKKTKAVKPNTKAAPRPMPSAPKVKVAVAKAKAEVNIPHKDRARVDHERSRSQFLVRKGKANGGGSLRVKYAEDASEADVKKAEKEAYELLKAYM